jgi:diadenosine tetraphosphate (Ap4A) HIT family hydrolase
MSYIQHIKTMKASGICPFCEEYKQDIAIDENATAYVLPARAPYTDDHILICTKRHVDVLQDLTAEELTDVYALIVKREVKLHHIHKEVVVFLRQGEPFGVTGKSVHHFHRHIVPHFTIKYGGTQEASDSRHMMDDKEYTQKITQMRER